MMRERFDLHRVLVRHKLELISTAAIGRPGIPIIDATA